MNYRERQIVALIASIVVGAIFIVIGYFVGKQDKMSGTIIIVSGVALMGIFIFRFITTTNSSDT